MIYFYIKSLIMLVTCVHVRVKHDKIEDFIRVTAENHRESVKERGNVRFDVIQQVDDPCSFMLYEAYESEESSAAHKNTDHYHVWKEAVQDMMAEPRKGVRYKILQPYSV